MNAKELVSRLAEKHREDVFVAECKNGPTWETSGLLRLDAWALRRSWSPLTTIGYEVKVSRADFEADQKWPRYLPLCHQFYFVCPAKLITALDLPPGVGLIWATKTGKLYTKIKAERRRPDPDAQAGLLHYVLMSRARIVADMQEANLGGGVDRLALHRAAVERAEARGALADFVGSHVRRRFHAQQAEVEEMTRRVKDADRLREHLAAVGIHWNPDGRWGTSEVRRQIDEFVGRLPVGLTGRLNDAIAGIQEVLNAVADVKRRAGAGG